GEVDVDPPIVAKLLLGLLERSARLLQPVLVDRPYPSGGHLGATPILVRDDPRQAVGLPPALPVTTRLLGLLLDQLAMLAPDVRPRRRDGLARELLLVLDGGLVVTEAPGVPPHRGVPHLADLVHPLQEPAIVAHHD